jgi:hypothetical protein
MGPVAGKRCGIGQYARGSIEKLQTTVLELRAISSLTPELSVPFR